MFELGTTTLRTTALLSFTLSLSPALGAPRTPGDEFSTFDWTVPGTGNVEFDTGYAVIYSDPQDFTAPQQIIQDGRLFVRNFTLPQGVTLRVKGPHPLRIIASGSVDISGVLDVSGSSFPGVVSLNTNSIPEPGAVGGPGGGRGGAGSSLTSASTPNGAHGRGPVGTAIGGGNGGETAYGVGAVATRRGSGGGGGVFAADRMTPEGCPIQTRIGFDAEPGFNGTSAGIGAITDQMPARGGLPGQGPFTDGDALNDFWGVARRGFETTAPTFVQGELLRLWAGAGGGAGGDTYSTHVFPTNPYNPNADDKGAGGGGGGGGLMIAARRSIVFGPNGRIRASGGTGGGGENTGGINRIGGGSGGGSGGHVVLQSAESIDFSAVSIGAEVITALGGQGGAGINETGGARAGGLPTTPQRDGVPDRECSPFFTHPGNPIGAGGDGGPGLVQLHVPVLANDGVTGILPPGGSMASLTQAIVPSPAGYDVTLGRFVDQLLPGTAEELCGE